MVSCIDDVVVHPFSLLYSIPLNTYATSSLSMDICVVHVLWIMLLLCNNSLETTIFFKKWTTNKIFLHLHLFLSFSAEHYWRMENCFLHCCCYQCIWCHFLHTIRQRWSAKLGCQWSPRTQELKEPINNPVSTNVSLFIM